MAVICLVAICHDMFTPFRLVSHPRYGMVTGGDEDDSELSR